MKVFKCQQIATNTRWARAVRPAQHRRCELFLDHDACDEQLHGFRGAVRRTRVPDVVSFWVDNGRRFLVQTGRTGARLRVRRGSSTSSRPVPSFHLSDALPAFLVLAA
jgi:hypothetical protein